MKFDELHWTEMSYNRYDKKCNNDRLIYEMNYDEVFESLGESYIEVMTIFQFGFHIDIFDTGVI